jgi:D-tyrosyl-tRNA(Tyr) deacylase
MKALIQRTSSASVRVEDKTIAETEKGLVVFLGIANGDDESDIEYLVDKIINLRIFESEKNRMDFSVSDIKGDILVVSQFTLCGDCNKGRRPDFTKAAPIEEAKELYKKAVETFKSTGLTIQEGEFQAYMHVNLINDGPVTIMLESKK